MCTMLESFALFLAQLHKIMCFQILCQIVSLVLVKLMRLLFIWEIIVFMTLLGILF
jgi:hypothetical protein